jgi:Family of unknown function (DUF6118)
MKVLNGGGVPPIGSDSHRDRWIAGNELMSAGNLESWAAIVRASQILAENQDAFWLCLATADRTKTKGLCSIYVRPTEH